MTMNGSIRLLPKMNRRSRRIARPASPPGAAHAVLTWILVSVPLPFVVPVGLLRQPLHDILPGTVIINTSAAIAGLEPLRSA